MNEQKLNKANITIDMVCFMGTISVMIVILQSLFSLKTKQIFLWICLILCIIYEVMLETE